MRIYMMRLFWVSLSGIILLTCQPSTVQQHPLPSAQIKFSEIPTDSVMLFALSPGIPGLKQVYKARDKGKWETALKYLADYFKETAKTRYYFSWEDFPKKYVQYFQYYPDRLDNHRRMSAEMKAMYDPDTQWKLPFKNRRGEDVSAYRLRHLARQSKHLDMVLTYFADPPETENLKYWVDQMADLNLAFRENAYDREGNAIYEVFRTGKRTHHWLLGHHAYLSTEDYTWQEQIESIRTFLHTAAQLAENGKKVRHGNHHTRGMVALFEIAATFREFSQADGWLDMATKGVTWHLEHEVNSDGFQFERTIHYHKSDIENYLRVWQLARRGKIQLPELYATQFKKMFDALLVLAQPDKRLPVLQDDTDALHAETNNLADIMTLGTILWGEPAYNYFSSGHVSPLFFWLLNDWDLNQLDQGTEKVPDISSAALEATGYYVMRNGWDREDEYMVINAGLSDTKPDHQHADMLGLVAYAHGNEILPNYQVKYNQADYQYWKSSWVKSVALIDSIPQAQIWKGNRGGSGFGKWLDLPQPHVNTYVFGEDIDYFSGSHDGYKSLNISYQRDVIFVKDGFWIVSDYFENPSRISHEYQQLWQGKYKPSSAKTVVATFDNGARFEIQSMDGVDCDWVYGNYKSKGSVIRLENSSSPEYRMTTLLVPYASGQQELPGGWTMISGTDLKQAFPELFQAGIGWVLKNENAILYYSDQGEDVDLRRNEPTFVYIKSGKKHLYSSTSRPAPSGNDLK